MTLFRNITITLLACAGVSQAAAGPTIAGCANEIPQGMAAVAELRHDDGGGPDFLVTAGVSSGQQVEVVHANRYAGVSPMLITHICIYTTNPDPGPGPQSMTVFIAHGDDQSFMDVRPGSSVWESTEIIQVGWQLVEVNPPVVAQSVTWIGARFPTATATNPHMGVTAHTDFLPDGVTPTPLQSFVGILNFAGGQDLWTDYEDIATSGFQGFRAILRGLTIDVANCNDAGIVVTGAQNLETTEAGGTATFSVALAGPVPTNVVLVLLSSSDTTEGEVGVIALTFTPGNAALLQTVVVTGQDDPFPDGDVPYTIGLLASSLDQCFHGIIGPTVPVINLDDDLSNCPEDIDGDLVVGILDFLAVLAQWGTGDPGADVNGDGIVGILDFLAVLAAWGPC